MAVDAVPAVVSTPSVRSRGSIREKKRLVCLWKRLSRTPGTVAAKEMADTDVLSFPCSINNNIINNPTSPYSHSSGHLPPVFADKGANQESTSACGCSHVSGSLEIQCSKASSSSSSSLARRMPSLLLPVGRGGFWSSTSAPAENFSLGWSARLIQPNEESCCTGEAVTGTRSCSPLPTPPEEDFDATSPSGDFDVCGGKVCGRVVETSSSCSTPMSTITVDRSRGREGPVGSPSGVGGRGGHRVVVDGGADDCHGGDGTGSSCCCSRVADDAGVSGVSESVEVCVEGDLFARSVGGGVELPNDSTMGPQQQQKYHHRNYRQRHRGIPSSRSWYWWTMFLYFSFFMVATVDAQLRPNTHARNTKDDGVCRSIDVRNSVANLEILRNCTVVEGFVQILLIDHAGEDSYANISFPKLREITGYLVLYRVNGLRTLENLFPNLSVIRGNTLFFNYALVVFEMLHMQRIGLPSLTDIMRGAVRIEKNPNLCFVDTIDWDMIAKAGKGEHFIAGNKQNNQCPKCAAHSKCPTSPVSNVTLCWNGTKCQKVCQYEGSCNETGERCHDMCLGGCSGPSSEDCYVCKKVVFGKDCLSECPANTYEYLNRRCIDSKECLEMPPPVENDIRGGNSWKIFNKTCIVECPPGYVSVNNNSCERCNSSCRKECPGNNVDSIAAAQELRGCTYIKGALEIQIRGIGNEEGGKNIVMELEDNLQMIEEIEDYLKIIRSFPLVSLNFLKNLSVIHGKKLDQYKYSLVVVENQNLQELWDRDSKKDMVKILNGRPFFHFNPKLCISKIDQIKQANFTNFTDIEVAKSSNGDKVPCNVSELKVRVTIKTAAGAVITWNAFKHHDPRSLLGYVVYVKEAPTQNVTLYDGRDACGGDGWQVYDVDPNGNSTENTHLITHLKAYTQYAFYVRTYTIATETTGAQSKIHYFRTEPDEPSKPLHLKAFSNSSHELIIQWMPPQSPNGNLTHYKIIGTWEKDDPELLEQRDYCVEPLTLPDKKPVVIIPEEDKKADKDTCACDEKNKKINKQKEKEVQFQIHFENFLHNKVYVKRNDRLRRDIRDFAEDGDLRSGYSNIQLLKEKDYLSNRDVLSYGDDDISNTSPSPPFSQPHPDIELNVVGIKHVLRELRNFAEYTIAVQACRETTEKEKINLSYVKYCSTKSIVTARTLKLDGADDIDSKSLAIDVFNETAGSVRLRWKEPERPNGIIVTYQIEYRRVDIENYKPVVECITRRHYQENGNSYTLKNLQPGKYKLRLRATSLAGNGAYTKMEEFDIKESTSSPVEDKLVYVITGAFISITLTVIIMILFKRKFGTKVPNMKLIASVNPEYVSAVYIPDEWEVARKKIELLRELGQGSFGMVYEGIARDVVEGKPEIRCAIKTVNEHATDRERIEFLNEASVMKAFNTHHVVQLLGVVSQGQPTLVVMELMANGDLKTYLRSHRPDAGVDHGKQPPTLKRILQMAIEIADGMAYLAAKKFVHRDLAARNCMVADDLTVKIGDFGMTRDIYETDYYRKGTKGLLPVRWMAPESLKDGVFTSFSDVWSYGVVLWEMATLASQPYQGLSNDQVLRYVIDGGVMERPENCPDKLYELMRICWQHKPVHRPTFLTLVSMLETDASPSFLHVSFYHSQEAEELRSHDTALAVPRAACIPIQGARIAEIEDDDDEEEEVGVVQTPTTPLRLTRDVEDFSVGGDSGSDVSMDEEGGEQEEGDREGRKEFSHRSERKGSGDEGGAKMHGGSGSSSGRWASMGGDGSKGMSVYSSDSSKGSKVSNGSAAANGYVMGRHNSFGVLKTTEC